MTSVIDEYFKVTKNHIEEYGEKCIVLMMIGAFYEMYGIREKKKPETKILMSEIENVCEICDLAVKQKTHDYKKKYDIFMGGFRDYTLDKYLGKITNKGYRCFVYDQFPEGKGYIRKLTNIYSPGTSFGLNNNSNKNLSNNICCIWINILKKKLNDYDLLWGFSTININTGGSNIFEFKSENNEMAINEIERYLSVHLPSEIIVILDNKYEKELNQYISIIRSSTNLLNVIDINNKNFEKIIKNCEKQTYIEESFKKYFEINDYSSFIEQYSYYELASQSFCFLLNWVYKHNVYLTEKLDEPKLEIHSKNMYLGCHSLKQLNMISENKNESVFDLLNICKTSMGKRKLKEIIVQPIYDNEYLNNEYEIIEKLNNVYEKITLPIRNILSSVRDNQELLRYLIMKKIAPNQIYNLYNNIIRCNEIISLIENEKEIVNYLNNKNYNISEIFQNNNEMKNELENIFKIDEISKHDSLNISENIFNTEYNAELNEFENNLITTKNKLNEIVSELNKIIEKHEGKTGNYVKLHETEKAPPIIICTKKRSKIIEDYINRGLNEYNIPVEFLSTLSISKNSSTNITIGNVYIYTISSKYSKLKDSWREILNKTFMLSIEQIIILFGDLKKMGDMISLVDVITTKSEISKRFNYCKPLIRNKNDKSYVNAREIRHCLIERLDNDDTYVTNDISLGIDEKGILLYGTNAVGKTSLIKALGISIILAQSGFYVPCSEFTYYPYKQMFTRILNNDNMFKGLSTFATEMIEMRTILNMSDENTCILGDELCSGTEHDSAVSIFVSGLQWLYNCNSSFIFATHLHEITQFDEINDMKYLSLKHLTVTYDRDKDTLTYDRKLKDGVGDTIYGLEVCKSLHLPNDFINNAYSIRNKYNNIKTPLDGKSSSRYNSKVILGMCSMCKKNDATEVHHLKEQQDADEKGFIGSLHKNHKSNLIAICDKCHLKIHKQNIKLEKKKTSKGVVIMEMEN